MKNKFAVSFCIVTVIVFYGSIPADANTPVPAGLTPEETIQATIDAIEANYPDHLFDLLPQSYQHDIERVVCTFAAAIDSCTWQDWRALLGQLSRVLTARQDFVIELYVKHMPPEDVQVESFREYVIAAATFAEKLSDSPLTDQVRLKEGKLRALLATDGRTVMEAMTAIPQPVLGRAPDYDLWTVMRAARIESAVVEDGTSTVTIVANDTIERIDLVQIEGAWVPAEMARNWEEIINTILQAIPLLDPTTPAGQQKNMQSADLLFVLSLILTQFEKAETVDDTMINQIILMGKSEIFN